jgi:hypothetical protein
VFVDAKECFPRCWKWSQKVALRIAAKLELGGQLQSVSVKSDRLIRQGFGSSVSQVARNAASIYRCQQGTNHVTGALIGLNV